MPPTSTPSQTASEASSSPQQTTSEASSSTLPSKECYYCHVMFPSRAKLMEHIFSDACPQEKALQIRYDNLLKEHSDLKQELDVIIDSALDEHAWEGPSNYKEGAALGGTGIIWTSALDDL